jgi:Tfp pilus assembly protein PilO
MPNKKTYIFFISALLVTFVMMGILVFVFFQVKSKNEKSAEISQQINRKITQEGNLEALQKVIEETKEKRQQLKSYIVDESHIDEFVGWVENQGESVGVPIIINTVSLSNTKKNTLAVSFSGSGSFDKVTKLVSLIEYSPYQVHIKNLSLNRTTQLADNTKPDILVTKWDLIMDFEVVSDNSFK